MSNIVRVLTFIDKSGGKTHRLNHKPIIIKHLRKKGLA
jgi:hypothetical protein